MADRRSADDRRLRAGDRPIDAVAAPFVMAQVNGLFGTEGLAVTIGAVANSQEAITRVSSGTSTVPMATPTMPSGSSINRLAK